MMAKYRHWLEQADVTVLHTDVTLLQLQSTHPHLFTTALHFGVMLHVCTHLNELNLCFLRFHIQPFGFTPGVYYPEILCICLPPPWQFTPVIYFCGTLCISYATVFKYLHTTTVAKSSACPYVRYPSAFNCWSSCQPPYPIGKVIVHLPGGILWRLSLPLYCLGRLSECSYMQPAECRLCDQPRFKEILETLPTQWEKLR